MAGEGLAAKSTHQKGGGMGIKIWIGLCMAGLCSVTSAQGAQEVDKKEIDACLVLAQEINKSHKLGIRSDGITRHLTWHDVCAERPPTGRGNVTALCQGTRTSAKGEQEVFFWQKSDHGKLHNGYFLCGA
jgi:hypothetical protein